MFKIIKNTNETINEIFSWRYQGDFDFYNFDGTIDEREELLSQNAFAVTNEKDELIGFCVFDASATVDEKTKKAYLEDRLDIGFGLAPHLCGEGLGGGFVKSIMEFGKKKFKQDKFRLTVASFNMRAIKSYKKIGFVLERVVKQRGTGIEFHIMVYN